MSEIPFTTGPLKNWPLYEEMFDQMLEQHGGIGSDETFRSAVLDLVKAAYAKLNREWGASLSLSSSDDLKQIEEWIATLNAQIHDFSATAIGIITLQAIQIVALERQRRN